MEILTLVHVSWLCLLRSIRPVGALTLAAFLGFLRCNEDVATQRVDRAEEFFMTAVSALRARVEHELAGIRKVPLVAVVTQTP